MCRNQTRIPVPVPMPAEMILSPGRSNVRLETGVWCSVMTFELKPAMPVAIGVVFDQRDTPSTRKWPSTAPSGLASVGRAFHPEEWNGYCERLTCIRGLR